MSNLRLTIFSACAAVGLAGCGGYSSTGPSPDMDAALKLRAALASAKTASSGATTDKGPAAAQKFDGWASLKGRFVFDGAKPAQQSITPSKDQAVCGAHPLFNESVVIGDDKGVANVIVFVRTPKLPVNDEYTKSAADKVVLDNKGCRFEPHVIGIRVGQTLVLKNDDPVAHNSNIKGSLLVANPLIPSGSTFETHVDAAEGQPVVVTCNIHDWMKGWIVARPDPYFAISDASGNFEIKDLPAGDLEFQVLHESAGPIAVNRPDLNWTDKGRFTVSLKKGEEKDLKDLTLTAAALKLQ